MVTLCCRALLFLYTIFLFVSFLLLLYLMANITICMWYWFTQLFSFLIGVFKSLVCSKSEKLLADDIIGFREKVRETAFGESWHRSNHCLGELDEVDPLMTDPTPGYFTQSTHRCNIQDISSIITQTSWYTPHKLYST